MNPGIIVAIVVVAIIVIAAIAWFATRARRTQTLKEQFGPEYDRTVQDTGDQRQAESLLAERRKRVERLNTRELTREERQSFNDRWQDVQARFVDDPAGAIGDADSLIADVMRTRGYPTDMPEQQEDVLTVEHPNVMSDYREAHEIAERNEAGDADTEALRTAMLRYRSIFHALVGVPTGDTAEDTADEPAAEETTA